MVPVWAALLPNAYSSPVDAVFPLFSSYTARIRTSIDPRPPWNATIEQQIARNCAGGRQHLGGTWSRILGPQKEHQCWRVSGPSSTAANIQSRRVFTLANPAVGQYYSDVYAITAVGVQDYRGLKLSVRRRAAGGLSFNANYTLSHCETDSPYNGLFISQFEYTDPNNPSYDRGNCPFNRTHVGNATVGYQTPQFTNTALRVVASDWRVSAVLNANSGNWLTVTTTSDPARTGVPQRVNQVRDNPYGARTLDNYLDLAAFAIPDVNTLAITPQDIEGPGTGQVNVALARVLRLATARTLELPLKRSTGSHVQLGGSATNINATGNCRVTTQQFLRLLQRTARPAVCGEVTASSRNA